MCRVIFLKLIPLAVVAIKVKMPFTTPLYIQIIPKFELDASSIKTGFIYDQFDLKIIHFLLTLF